MYTDKYILVTGHTLPLVNGTPVISIMLLQSNIDILYVISIQTHGNGGHFHSLNHISSFLANHYSVGIISIGRGESQVLKNNPHFIGHISLKGWDYLLAKRKVQNLITQRDVKYVHCFDWSALSVMGAMLRRTNIVLAHTKCGGPNVPYPPVENLVLFSQENFDYFNSMLDFQASNIALISNRVRKLERDNQAILNVSDKFTFIAISRIGSAYYHNLDKSLKLIADLTEDGKDVELFIIGAVEKNEYLVKLQEVIDRLNLPATILTGSAYTSEASRYISSGDAFIGSGRGVMEACSLGIPVLSHSTNMGIPVLLDDDTFSDLFKNNFSPRSVISNDAKSKSYSKISSIVDNDEMYSRYSSLSDEYFNKYFNLETSLSRYVKFYEDAKRWNFSVKAHSIKIARALFRFYKPS